MQFEQTMKIYEFQTINRIKFAFLLDVIEMENATNHCWYLLYRCFNKESAEIQAPCQIVLCRPQNQGLLNYSLSVYQVEPILSINLMIFAMLLL